MSTVTPNPHRWWALALLCGAFFMVILDANIVIVALPSIEAALEFSEQGLQWVISAYALSFAGLLLLGGRAADPLGRRRLFMFGLLAFTLASTLAASVAGAASTSVRAVLVFGLGIGPTFATATIAALAGVRERDAGIASGLSNTAFQLGGALGVAIVSTVAVSRSNGFLAANDGADPLVVLTEGLRSAFVACVALSAAGVALALLLLGASRTAALERPESTPATATAGRRP